MSLFIVDASVGVKWFIPEIHEDHARRLQDPGYQLHCPTFVDVEIGNILWKKVRRGELTRTEADGMLASFGTLPLTRHPEAGLLPAAFDLADRTQRTVYDCLYLALAIQLNGPLVTADERFYNALKTTAWSVHLCWIEDVP